MVKTQHPNSILGTGDSVFIAGLGRFGSALAMELAAAGAEVLAADADDEVVEALSDQLDFVVRADTTKEAALRQLAVPDFTHAVVAIGSNLEGSILTASWMLRLGVPTVWAKAVTEDHGQILSQLGVHHVVHPESEMGRRVAHLLRGSLADYEDVGGGFVMVSTSLPRSMYDKRRTDIRAQRRGDINIVAIRPGGGQWEHVTDETVLTGTSDVIVFGRAEHAEQFADM